MLGTPVNGRLRMLLVAGVLVAATLAASAQAAQAAAAPKRLYACVTERFNTLNLSSRKARCPEGQFKISWKVNRARAASAASPGPTAAPVRPGLPALPGSG